MGVLAKPIPFGDYFLLEKLNTGGMAEVFKAKTFGVEGFERIVAVKKILPSIAEDKEFISMFIDEAKIAVQLNHSNIAQIFDLGNINDEYYIALEYVPGHDLRVIYDRCVRHNRKLDIACVCYIVSKICEGLDFAHNKKDANGEPMNIIHRDISPQNILLSYEGDCKLIDFGIAKATNKSSATQVGILKGKFSYMSPEQVSGKANIDRRSDIFALGIVLFEMLTLKRLFLGSSDFETLEKIRKVEVSPPTLYNSDIPEELEDIVMRALEKDVSARYQTANELQEALQRFMFKQNIYYTAKDLSEFMHSMFAQEIELEQKKREFYKELTRDVLDQSRHPSSPEEETAFYERNHVHKMSGVQYDAVVSQQQPAPKQAIYAELDDFEPPKSDIVFSNKNNGQGQSADNVNAIISASVARENKGAAARKSLVASEPVVINKGRETIMAPAIQRRNSNRAFFVPIVCVLIGIIVALVAFAFVREKHGNDGKISFHLEPAYTSGKISINGDALKDLPKSPFSVSNLSTKNMTHYRIVVDGFNPVEGRIQADADGENVKIQLQPAQQTGLKFYVNVEMAEVTLDGKRLSGHRTFEALNISPGKHHVVIRKEGYKDIDQMEFVDEGDVLELHYSLKPALAALVIKTEPYEARYELRNLRTGETKTGKTNPSGQLITDLPVDDEYKITIFDGSERTETLWKPAQKQSINEEQYRVFTTRFDPNAAPAADNEVAAAQAERPAARPATSKPAEQAKKTTKPATSKPKAEPTPAKEESVADAAPAPVGNVPGIMQINSKPPCNIIINGKDYGMTPKKIELPAGTYKVTLVNVAENINHEISVPLGAGEVKKVLELVK